MCIIIIKELNKNGVEKSLGIEIRIGGKEEMNSRSFLNKYFKGDFADSVDSVLKEVWGVSEICGSALDKIKDILLDSLSPAAFDEIGKSFKGNGAIKSGFPTKINTYPIGTETKDVHQDFLGICYGNNKINTVLKVAVEHCIKMCNKYDYDDRKTIMILTNKWDEPSFQQFFAGTFINFAIKHNVVFIFILVTSSGMTIIPFLPLNRGRLRSLRNEKVDYGEKYADHNRKQGLPNGSYNGPIILPAGKDRSGNVRSETGNYIPQEILDNFHSQPVICNYRADEFGLNDKQDYIFEIVINKNSSWRNNITGASGRIHKKTVKKFVKEISGFIKLPDNQIKNLNSNNNPTHLVEISGYNFHKEFRWNTTNRVLFENLENAFKELIRKKLE